MSAKTDIRECSLPELEDYLEAKNEKRFRAKQIQEWLWKKSAHSFVE